MTSDLYGGAVAECAKPLNSLQPVPLTFTFHSSLFLFTQNQSIAFEAAMQDAGTALDAFLQIDPGHLFLFQLTACVGHTLKQLPHLVHFSSFHWNLMSSTHTARPRAAECAPRTHNDSSGSWIIPGWALFAQTAQGPDFTILRSSSSWSSSSIVACPW